MKEIILAINNKSMSALLVECAFVDSSLDTANYNPEKTAAAIYLNKVNQLSDSKKHHWLVL